MSVFRVCALGWSPSVWQRKCVASLPYILETWQCIGSSKVRHKTPGTHINACTPVHLHMHVNTWTWTIPNPLYPLELLWAFGVSQCWCPLASCNCNFLALLKTEVFLCSPELGSVQQGAHSVKVLTPRLRTMWQGVFGPGNDLK